MSGKLTTHVLDLGQGCPAVGVLIELYDVAASALIGKAVTNRDGRVDAPLLSEEQMKAGRYELRFYVGDYYRTLALPAAETSIWDVVPLQFEIRDESSNYHIPLLISPGGYSTYRGS
ncbi:hydroxyisourate hydrolase [Paenibacillus campi]|uniref:hydroxyisourate hydrolase n=1 Tax=Paenibacillus campi TaxID=3106031 RepID=UPI002B002202|nr:MULTISPECIES: hydroxyisourate hydrolase [unclassified Paenibacillus]